MGRFETTKKAIDANIKTNGKQEITGSGLNSVLKSMLSATDAELTELSEKVNAIGVSEHLLSIYEVRPNAYIEGTGGDSSGLSSSSVGNSVAVYEVTIGQEYTIVIPETGNVATYVIAQSDTLSSQGLSLKDSIKGTSAPETLKIVAAYNYLYVCYAAASGEPMVTYLDTEFASKTELYRVKSQVNEIENKVFVPTTIDIPYIDKSAYVLNIGEAPIQATNSDYMAFVIDVKKGDIVTSNMRTGNSYKSYAKVKDGVVIEVGKTGVSIDAPIVCDGSFDTLIINNYSGYVRTPTAVLETKVIASPVAEKEIKILCFGNSFTQDSMSYVPFILKNIAPDLNVTIGIAYLGGCTLAQHCANLTGSEVTSDGVTFSPTPYVFHLYKNRAISWITQSSVDVEDVLVLEDWDIITFQQAGGYSYREWEIFYAPFIYKIHKAIFDKMSHPVKLGWLSIHGAYANDLNAIKTRWEQTTENTEKVQNLTGNEVIFPFGTAVQNLSTIASLADIGDGVGMTADGAHLHEGLPCLAAAYANALTILREAGLEWKSIIGEGTRPTKEWCNTIKVPTPNYGATTNDVVGVTDDNAYYAQVAAIQALKKPYELTDISMILA